MKKMTLELDHFEPNKTIVKIHTNCTEISAKMPDNSAPERLCNEQIATKRAFSIKLYILY